MYSQSVDTFKDLVSLMVADRLKQTLSKGCLQHVLSVEVSTDKHWLGYDKLAEVVDTYTANLLHDKPRIDFQSEHVGSKKANVVPSMAQTVDVSKSARVSGDSSTVTAKLSF